MNKYSNIYEGHNKIKEIIDSNRIVAKYQPIISLVKKKIVGFEGLSRGISKLNSELISPVEMFEYAYEKGIEVTLDRLCREKCIEGFKNNRFENMDLYLFVNIETSIIEQVGGSNYLFNQVLKLGSAPESIVIEINESNVQNTENLMRFVNNYKKAGFLIALDDVGAGFSNFERISLVKPDIIKLDRSLIKDIEKSYHKQEIFKCLVNLANKIGAIVIAEGVETKEELNSALEFGAHLIQGYFFSKPEFLNSELINELEAKINSTALEYKNYMNLKMKKNQIHRRKIHAFLSDFIVELENEVPKDFDHLLLKFVKNYNYNDLNIECAYVLDEQGTQISNTIFCSDIKNNHKHGLMFYPALKGADNSLKKYYYELINSTVNMYTSDPYISHATGNVNITLSRIFNHNTNNKYILCVDFIHKFK